MTYQWDATALITCARFQVEDQLILDYALEAARIVISAEVCREVVDAGRIEVRTASDLPDPYEEVLGLYGLEPGDKAIMRLALQAPDLEATVTDDRLLFVVLHRCGRQALFLPDVVEKAVADSAWDLVTGQQILLAVRPRLASGFVEHSLRRLEGVI